MNILDNAIAIWTIGVVIVGFYGVFEKGADWSGYAPYPIVRALFWPIIIPILAIVAGGYVASWVRRLFSQREVEPATETTSNIPFRVDHAGRKRYLIHPILDAELAASDAHEKHTPMSDPDGAQRRKNATAYARAWNTLDPTLLPAYEQHVCYRSDWMDQPMFGASITEYLSAKIIRASQQGPFSKGPLAAEMALDAQNRHCVLMYQGNLETPIAAVHFEFSNGSLASILMKELDGTVHGSGNYPA